MSMFMIMTGPSRTESTCIFGKLSEEVGDPVVDNYLDESLPKGNNQEILDRINKKRNNCEDYSLLKDNCEHLATYVRYGTKCSEQVQRATDSALTHQHVLKTTEYICLIF